MHVFIALCLLVLQPTSLWGRSVSHRAHGAHGAWGSSSESLKVADALPRNNIAELLLPLIEQGLSAEHSSKHSKKVIQVLPVSNSQEHSASWPNLSTRRKHVVEITPLRGKGRDGQPLAYILSPAKRNRRPRKRGNKHHDSHSHEQRDHGNHQEKPSKDFDVSTVTKEILDSSEAYSESISSERLLVEPSQERSESISGERDVIQSSEEHSKSFSHEEQSVQASAERSESNSEEEIVNPSDERTDSTYHEEEIVQTSEETESFSQEEVIMEPSEGKSENISHKQVVFEPLKEGIESIIHEGVVVHPLEDPNSSGEKKVVSFEDSGSISYENNVVPPLKVHKESIMVPPEEHSESISQEVTVNLLKEYNKRISSRQQSIEEDTVVDFSDTSENAAVEPDLIGDRYKINFEKPVINDDNTDQNKEVVVEHPEEPSKSVSDSEQIVKEAAVVSSDTVQNTAIESIGEKYNRDVSDQDISIRGLVTSQNSDSSDRDVIEKIVIETNNSKDNSEPSEENYFGKISDDRSNSNENNQTKAPFDNRSDSNSQSEDTISERPHGKGEYSIRKSHHNDKDRNQPEDSNSEHPETNEKHGYSNQYVDYSKNSLAATQLESVDVQHLISHHNDQSEITGLIHDTNQAMHKVLKGHQAINSAELKDSRNLDESTIQTHTNHEEYEHIHHNPEKLSEPKISDDIDPVELNTIHNASSDRNIESDGSHSEKQDYVRKIEPHGRNVATPHRHPHNRKENENDSKISDDNKSYLAVKSTDNMTDNIQMPMVEITVSQTEKQQKTHSENPEDISLGQNDHLKNAHTIVAEIKQPASSSETERDVVISQRGVLNNIWEPHSKDLIKLIQSSGEQSDSDTYHAPWHTEHQNSNANIHEHKSYRLSFLFNKK